MKKNLAAMIEVLSDDEDEEVEDPRNENYDDIVAGLNRPKLEGLQKGDKIKFKKPGQDYRTKSEGRPVVFVRYLTESEKQLYNETEHDHINDYDAIYCPCIDKRDGEVILFLGNTSEMERIEEPKAAQ